MGSVQLVRESRHSGTRARSSNPSYSRSSLDLEVVSCCVGIGTGGVVNLPASTVWMLGFSFFCAPCAVSEKPGWLFSVGLVLLLGCGTENNQDWDKIQIYFIIWHGAIKTQI